MLMQLVRPLVALVFLVVSLSAQDMTTIHFGGSKQGVNDKIQWADNNDPMRFEIDVRIRLANGTVVRSWFSMEVHSNEYSRTELATLVATRIRADLTAAGVSAADAAKMASSGGTSVHVDDTKPADQPTGGGTPDKPLVIDHQSDAPLSITQFIS